MGKIKDKILKGEINTALDLGFRVDTCLLLDEIAESAMPRSMGVLKIPLNSFKGWLSNMAELAVEKNDPEMNIIMLCLGFYEIPPHEIPSAIDAQINLIKSENT